MKKSVLVGILCASALVTVLCGTDLSGSLLEDRLAIDRVYSAHRLGAEPDVAASVARAAAERRVRTQLMKERVLEKIYGVVLSDDAIHAEVRRIEASTRAPERLAEIKAALGNDPVRFARSMARPLLVERILRRHFENDVTLHAGLRRKAEQARKVARDRRGAGLPAQRAALAGSAGTVTDLTWERRAHSGEWTHPGAFTRTAPPAVGVMAKGGAYAVEATVEVAVAMRAPDSIQGGRRDPVFHFDDLHPALRKVMEMQLQEAGDVSAVIERPAGFQLFLLEERTSERFRVSALFLPKRSYDAWLSNVVKEL